ncbi:MAG: hypothetical protein JWL65_4513 [Gammaproteobacteria bacterium]|jgi:hypothetical protein|nr:hypothetical protein [Gammaproteobacteria bacterium]
MVLTMSTVNPHLKFLVVDDFSTMPFTAQTLSEKLGKILQSRPAG